MQEAQEVVTGNRDDGLRGWGRELWEIAKILLISVAIVLPVRYFVVQPFIVRGASMEPNFYNREYLIIDEASYRFREPTREEAVVFRYPRDPHQFFIKRIIGLPREEIEIKGGRVSIISAKEKGGRFLLSEPYLLPPDRPTYPDYHTTLKENEYFVLGDNRDFSSDSRVWGPLEKKYLVGRVLFRAWPPARFGFIPEFAPAH